MSVSTIVIGIDGSKGSARALDWAADLAKDTGARVVAIHTFEPLEHLDTAPCDFHEIEEGVRARAEQDWVKPLQNAGVAHEVRIMHGTPAQVLIDAADDVAADLVVVGARGLGTLRGLALGSTSNKLVHACHRPVVVVPPPEAAGRR